MQELVKTYLYILLLDGIPRDSVEAVSFTDAYKKMCGVWDFLGSGNFVMQCGNKFMKPSEAEVHKFILNEAEVYEASYKRFKESKWSEMEEAGLFNN